MKKAFAVVLKVFLVMCFISCTGKQGSAGPAGATGPAGSQQPGLYYIRMFQQGVYPATYNGQVQTSLYSGNSNAFYKNSNLPVNLGVSNTGGIYRALFKFDLSALPASKIMVDKAELTIKTDSVSYGGGAQNIKVYMVTSYWAENQAGENSRTDTLTWTNWGGDYSSNTITPNAGSVNILPDSTIMISLDPATVQGWMESPATNYGMLFRATDESIANNYAEIYSSGAPTASNRPMLKIWYYTTE